jgi:hypothetical protein
MATWKYTRERLAEAVKTSSTVREVMRKCGAKNLAGGTHAHVSRTIKKLGLDTRHFLGQRSNLGRGCVRRKSADEILVIHRNGQRQRAVQLARALLEIGREYKCYICGLKEWRKKKLVLEIEHKNSDFENDERENLEFICPNCHSQTLTFCRGAEKEQIKLPRPKKPRSSRKRVNTRNSSDDGYWRTRDKVSSRKVVRPTVEELTMKIESMPMVQIGKLYGVSDNAVRKWAKRYGIEL